MYQRQTNPLGWTDDEDAIIIKAYPQLATSYNKWAKIAELLKGRSNEDVRNRWRYKLHKEMIHPLSRWTNAEDYLIIKAYQRFATIRDKWVKIAKLLPGRSNTDVWNRWQSSLWDYERTHPDHLQGHATILVKHFVSEDHDGMNLSGLYTAYAHQEGAPVYYCQLDNEQVAYIRRLSNRWHIVLQQQPQLPLYSSAPDTASLPPKDTWARYNCDGPELELFY